MRQLSQSLVRLNVETQSLHAAVDAPWLDLADAGKGFTRLDYVHHLVGQYGFDAPLEAALAYTPHIAGVLELPRRFRAGLIAKDLLTLGVSASDIAHLRQCMIAPFASVAEALGWLYVHQRSTLLRESVREALLCRMPELEPATSCLRQEHGHVGDSWDELGQAFDRVARSKAIEGRIVGAATDAFGALIAWNRRASDRQVGAIIR